MFRVKICGITTPQDGAHAIAAGADAVGLNFFAGSRRYVTPQQAQAIAEPLSPGAKKVGVFVNASAAKIREIANFVRLDMIQLHGDEPPELVAELAGLHVIRAIRLGEQGWDACHRYFDRCQELGAMPCAVLVDSLQKGEYGGTGRSPDWTVVRQYRALGIGVPLVLAGGLTHDNVAEAINIVRPDAVDTASGVESVPGVKDDSKVTAFVSVAWQALLSKGAKAP